MRFIIKSLALLWAAWGAALLVTVAIDIATGGSNYDRLMLRATIGTLIFLLPGIATILLASMRKEPPPR